MSLVLQKISSFWSQFRKTFILLSLSRTLSRVQGSVQALYWLLSCMTMQQKSRLGWIWMLFLRFAVSCVSLIIYWVFFVIIIFQQCTSLLKVSEFSIDIFTSNRFGEFCSGCGCKLSQVIMVQSSDRIRRWWAVFGFRVRVVGIVGGGGGREDEWREDNGFFEGWVLVGFQEVV